MFCLQVCKNNTWGWFDGSKKKSTYFSAILMKKELCFDSIFGPSLSFCILGAAPCSLKPVSSCAALTININNLFSWQRRSSSFIEKAEFAFEVLDEEWTSTSQYWRPGAFSPTKVLNTGCNTLQATKEGLQCAATQKKTSLETPERHKSICTCTTCRNKCWDLPMDIKVPWRPLLAPKGVVYSHNIYKILKQNQWEIKKNRRHITVYARS